MNKKAITVCLVLASLLASATILAAPKRPKKNAAPVDPAIEAISRSAQKNHARFEQIKHTMKKWGPHTNVVARLARQSTMEKLTAERDVSKWTRNLWKAKLKAEKKDQKNYEKWVKDTEKARDKSSEELAEFFQSVLDQAAAAREEDQQIRDTDM